MLRAEIELDEQEIAMAIRHWCVENGFDVDDNASVKLLFTDTGKTMVIGPRGLTNKRRRNHATRYRVP